MAFHKALVGMNIPHPKHPHLTLRVEAGEVTDQVPEDEAAGLVARGAIAPHPGPATHKLEGHPVEELHPIDAAARRAAMKAAEPAEPEKAPEPAAAAAKKA